MGILITLLELAVFLSTPYSKSILPVYPLNNLIWSIVLFTVFFFSFSAFVIFGFAKKTFLLYKKQIVISFFALLFIRVILDIGCYIFKSTEIKSIYSLLTDCVFFVIIFQIITFAYTGRNLLKDIYGKIKGKEKSIVVILLFYVLVVAIVVSYLVYIFINLQMYAEKYTIDSSFYLFKSMNYNFNSQLLRMFTAIILQILLVIILNNLYANNFDADLYWSKIFLNIIARTIVAFIAIFVLLFIKICISNVGTIAKTPERSSDCYIGLPNLISNSFTDSNLNHTGIYLYSKGKIMIHLTFDYKTDEKCTTPGQYLKYHRTFQGLSTRELAEKVGIVPATLVLYENDRHPIKYSTAVALANVLGIDRNRLLDEYTAFVDYPYFSLLKKVRQDLSLTQIQMAELIGIGQTSYSGWEREIRVPRRKEYDKILAALKKLRVNVDTYLCQSASI